MSIANGLALPNALSNGTTNDAVPVMADFNYLLAALNRALLDTGGGAGVNAQNTQIHNLAAGTSANDAVSLTQLGAYALLAGAAFTGACSFAAATTMAALTASGLITGNAGFSGTTLSLSGAATLSGGGTSTTPAANDNSTKIATTAYADGAVSADHYNINTQTVASAATVTPTFANDLVNITAQAAALTLANWTGTPINGWSEIVRIADNGTQRAISYGTNYLGSSSAALPASTTVGKTTEIAFTHNSTTGKHVCTSVLTY